MNNKNLLLSFLLLLGASGTANAQTTDTGPHSSSDANAAPKPPRVQFGAKMAVAVPNGDFNSKASLDEAIGTTFTFDLLLDVRLSDRVMLTPYAGFADGAAGSGMQKLCDQLHQECKAGGIQAGSMLRVAYARNAHVEAWVGYAFSREWRFAGSDSAMMRFSGFDHHALTGLDFYVHGTTKMGLYAELAVGSYDSVELDVGSIHATNEDSGGHQWVSFGFQTMF